MRSLALMIVKPKLKPGDELETQLLIQEREFLIGALLNRLLDDATRSALATKMDIKAEDFPKIEKTMEFIHHRFTSSFASCQPLSSVAAPSKSNIMKPSIARVNNVQQRGESGKKYCYIC